MDKKKVKIELDVDVVNELIKMKKVGDTYSDIIRRLLKKGGKKHG
jgi:predicted CopG family antitoxin